MAAPPDVDGSAGGAGAGTADRGRPITAEEMRGLCAPLEGARAAIEGRLGRERRLFVRLGGVLIALTSLVVGLPLFAVGPGLGAGLVAILAFAALGGVPLIAPGPLLRVWGRLHAMDPARGEANASTSAVLYRTVDEVLHTQESAHRLRALTILIGVLVALVATVFGGLGASIAAARVVPGLVGGSPAGALLLLAGTAGTLLTVSILWMLRRLGRLAELEREAEVRRGWLEQLERTLWARF